MDAGAAAEGQQALLRGRQQADRRVPAQWREREELRIRRVADVEFVHAGGVGEPGAVPGLGHAGGAEAVAAGVMADHLRRRRRGDVDHPQPIHARQVGTVRIPVHRKVEGRSAASVDMRHRDRRATAGDVVDLHAAGPLGTPLCRLGDEQVAIGRVHPQRLVRQRDLRAHHGRGRIGDIHHRKPAAVGPAPDVRTGAVDGQDRGEGMLESANLLRAALGVEIDGHQAVTPRGHPGDVAGQRHLLEAAPLQALRQPGLQSGERRQGVGIVQGQAIVRLQQHGAAFVDRCIHRQHAARDPRRRDPLRRTRPADIERVHEVGGGLKQHVAAAQGRAMAAGEAVDLRMHHGQGFIRIGHAPDPHAGPVAEAVHMVAHARSGRGRRDRDRAPGGHCGTDVEHRQTVAETDRPLRPAEDAEGLESVEGFVRDLDPRPRRGDIIDRIDRPARPVAAAGVDGVAVHADVGELGRKPIVAGGREHRSRGVGQVGDQETLLVVEQVEVAVGRSQADSAPVFAGPVAGIVAQQAGRARIGQRPDRDAAAAVIPVPAAIQMFARPHQAIDGAARGLGRRQAQRARRVGVVPGRHHAAGRHVHQGVRDRAGRPRRHSGGTPPAPARRASRRGRDARSGATGTRTRGPAGRQAGHPGGARASRYPGRRGRSGIAGSSGRDNGEPT